MNSWGKYFEQKQEQNQGQQKDDSWNYNKNNTETIDAEFTIVDDDPNDEFIVEDPFSINIHRRVITKKGLFFGIGLTLLGIAVEFLYQGLIIGKKKKEG